MMDWKEEGIVISDQCSVFSLVERGDYNLKEERGKKRRQRGRVAVVCGWAVHTEGKMDSISRVWATHLPHPT